MPSIIHVPRRFVANEWGGTETVILEISKQQKAAGAHPRIITSMALAETHHDVIGGIEVERHAHLYPFFGLTTEQRAAMDKKGGNLLSLPLLSALLRAPDVRLFHAHALKRLGGTVRTVARLRRKPYVVSLHGGIFDVPAAELADLTQPIQGKFEWGKPLGALLGARRVLDDADHVICVGESEAIKARQQLGHDRVSYLPNGVDSQRFAHGDGSAFRARFQVPADAFLIVNVGRIDSQKNHLCLLQAFARFHATTPHARLVLIGPITQPTYAEKLRAFIAAENLTESVQIIPGLGNDSGSLVDAYHAADAFVLASRHEPFGIVVLEAWCAARPVIASRVGGLQSLIRDGETGLFFDPEAADAADQLADRLNRLHASPSLRQQLGEAGRQEAFAHYDWARISERLEGIYQLAETHAAGPRTHAS
ncbi:glycosyltransferase involved in cell wall biosynthesis [Haloferula luteola]|uniref:Glycosyltransferase involved in cell wall biosynthesis n=1 Tax=Haloferula luteola TaxID=595692 RepID=A0A840VAA7_9BACT|nr:glycosyltransferase family 4 protein [Haloferula luteola]MBB5350880.1 glycosyltransferase involved in cell wall biosynthesis [Haloferula luteola]